MKERDTYNAYINDLKRQIGFVTIADSDIGIRRQLLFETFVGLPKYGKHKSKLIITPTKLQTPPGKYFIMSCKDCRDLEFGDLMEIIKRNDHADVMIYDLKKCLEVGDISEELVYKLSRTFKRNFRAAMQRNLNINTRFCVDISGLSEQEIYDLNLDFTFFQQKINKVAEEENKGSRHLYWKNEFSPGDNVDRYLLDQAHKEYVLKPIAKAQEKNKQEYLNAIDVELDNEKWYN